MIDDITTQLVGFERYVDADTGLLMEKFIWSDGRWSVSIAPLPTFITPDRLVSKDEP